MTLSEAELKDFEAAARPMIGWLNRNCHPHVTVLIDPTSAELCEGIATFRTNEYIPDDRPGPTLAPHQERVIQEKVELDEKLKKLNDFFKTETFSSLGYGDTALLTRQFEHMLRYSETLGERIAAFGLINHLTQGEQIE